jgi:PPOX class probable F420-dependent enzyme
MTIVQSIARLQYRIFDRMRHREAFRVARQPAAATDFEPLHGHHYCLLVTFRRSGEPVPTPVLFGMHDGKLYLRTDTATAKVARIRNDSRVLVGPANSRGKPRGPLARGTARLMSVEENDAAYGVLRQSYRPMQRLGERMIDLLPIEMTYIEVVPT